MILIIFQILQYFHFISQRLIRCHESDRTVVSSAVKSLRTHQILYFIIISHEIFRRNIRTVYFQEPPFCLDMDRHKAPCIFHERDGALGRFFHIFKEHALSLKCQEDTLLLLDPHKEFFHCLISERPLSHIIIEMEDPLIFIFQNLIEISGAEQASCFGEIFDRKLSEIIRALHLSVACHNIRFLNNGCKGQFILSAGTHNGKLSLFHMSRLQSSAIICKFYSRRVPFEPLVFKMNTKRRGIYDPSYLTVIITLY